MQATYRCVAWKVPLGNLQVAYLAGNLGKPGRFWHWHEAPLELKATRNKVAKKHQVANLEVFAR